MSQRRRAAALAGAAATAAALAVALPAAGGTSTREHAAASIAVDDQSAVPGTGAVGARSARGAPGATAARARRVRGATTVRQLIVLRDNSGLTARVRARQATVRVHGDRCAVAAATPLAALVRSRPGPLRLRDYGSCSSRPEDGAGLFVSGIRGDRNRGQNGWVYKVGRRAGSAGAADPSGPFGNGRLRQGARVTWFYCQTGVDGCQRTLSLTTSAAPGGVLVRVTGSDDRGHGVPVAGATVHAGAVSATTGADGSVVVSPPPGAVRVFAEKAGLVRSFDERVGSR